MPEHSRTIDIKERAFQTTLEETGKARIKPRVAEARRGKRR